MNIPPILLAKAFIIMAFVGGFITATNMYRSGDWHVLVFFGFIWGAVYGMTVLGVGIAAVLALTFLFT